MTNLALSPQQPYEHYYMPISQTWKQRLREVELEIVQVLPAIRNGHPGARPLICLIPKPLLILHYTPLLVLSFKFPQIPSLRQKALPKREDVSFSPKALSQLIGCYLGGQTSQAKEKTFAQLSVAVRFYLNEKKRWRGRCRWRWR